MKKPALTPKAFDAVVDKVREPKRDRIIWTLPRIAERIGVGVDFVRDTLVKEPGSPVREMGGKYYVFEDDLLAFLRNPRETIKTHAKPLGEEGPDQA